VSLTISVFFGPNGSTQCLEPDSSTQFVVRTIDYSGIVPNLTGITPAYIRVPPVRGNVLGVAYNAPNVLGELVKQLKIFKQGSSAPTNLPVAAVQVDMVAHSLGGLIARGMALVGTSAPARYPGPDFYGAPSYGKGYLHKLITLGTPHLGTNLAKRTIDGNNVCVRNLSSWVGEYNLDSATIGGTKYPGATSDQAGDPTTNSLSLTLNWLNSFHTHTIPTALIAAKYEEVNNSVKITINGDIVKAKCGTLRVGGLLLRRGEFLADNYSFDNWKKIYNGEPSDVIVPYASATYSPNRYFSPLDGVVHGPGTVGLGNPLDPHIGFMGPQLLDPNAGPGQVFRLLNTHVHDSKSFVSMP